MSMRGLLLSLPLVWSAPGCTTMTCGEGTHGVGDECVADDDGGEDTGTAGDTDTDSGADTDSDTDSDTGSDTDTGTDSGTDSDSGTDTETGTDTGGDTGPCAAPDDWTGPVPAALYTSGSFDPSYDAGMDDLLDRIGGYGAGSFGEAIIVAQATVVAVGIDPRYNSAWYYVGDGFGTVPLLMYDPSDTAELGDKVMFAITQYEGWAGVPLAKYPGSWTVSSSGNPVAVRELGAAAVDYTDHYSELVHASGELLEASSMECGSGYTCFVFEHDGVRDRVRVPQLNSFGLDVDYAGGLCAEVVAPAGIYQDSDGVHGYFIDILDENAMRTWARPSRGGAPHR